MATDNDKPEIQGIESRVLTAEDMELRVEGDKAPRLTGYAAKFNRWSEDLGGFREKIAPGAFSAVLKDDVRCLKNHDANLILGRTSSGTLKLESNSVGLKYTVDVPDTTTGRDTVEEVRRKDITGCSFSFSVLEDDWRYLEDGSIERTIIKLRSLYDVGPVTYPAYPDTTVAARSLEQFRKGREPVAAPGKEDQSPVEAAPPKTISPERQREINYSYQEMGRIIESCRQADA
ncbi:MAG: HK97 family phage prohead protease [Phycisphaerales bacterium]